MGGWLGRWHRDFIARTYFDKGGSGETLFIPAASINPFGRRSYVVPDDATRDRIVDLYARADVVDAVSFAVLAAAWLATYRYVPESIRTLVLAALILAVAIGLFAFRQFVAHRFGRSLAPGPERRLRAVLAVHEREIGPTLNVWIYMAVLAALAIVTGAGAWDSFSRGRYAAATILFTVVVAVWIPLFAAGPHYLRMRRLQAENKRLEAVVRARTAELEELNRTLEARVEEQVRDIERLGQLRHFFAAPVADLILGGNASDLSNVHRRELSVVSIDLRGFTAFSETAEPEEVIGVLRAYHAELGILVNRYQATLEHFAGDGAMIFLNDPVEIPDHPERAVRLATELRTAMRPHLEEWRRTGFDLGMGAGIAVGYATIGAIGYEGRWEYAAIGNVCNLANRLCSEAKDGQVITTHRVGARIDPATQLVPLGELALKGFARPIAAFNVAAG